MQHLHLVIAERAGGSHHDRFTRVDTQGVEVLHAGHGEAVVVGIADNLELNLLPSLQRLFHENLLAEGERAFGQLHELLLILTDTATQSAQGVSRTDHHGEADALSSSDGIFHRLYGLADGSLHFNLVELLHEEVAVFGVHDGIYRCTQHLHTILLEDAAGVEVSTTVECRLSAKGQQDAVGTLLLDDFLYKEGSHGQEIHLVGNALRCLDGGHIGIHQH